jgi:hypothetical protein
MHLKLAFSPHRDRAIAYAVGCQTLKQRPDSIPGQYLWDMWWTMWHWDTFFCRYLSYPKYRNINFARAQRLGWFGHIERMQETRMVKANTPGNPFQRGQQEDQRHAGRMMIKKIYRS